MKLLLEMIAKVTINYKAKGRRLGQMYKGLNEQVSKILRAMLMQVNINNQLIK